jgi:hypothetical protein
VYSVLGQTAFPTSTATDRRPLLAAGETTTVAAKKFDLCPGRISQIRKELFRAWQIFQGEILPLA